MAQKQIFFKGEAHSLQGSAGKPPGGRSPPYNNLKVINFNYQ